MSQTYRSLMDTYRHCPVPSLSFVKADDCILHPRRVCLYLPSKGIVLTGEHQRRLRHVNGIYLRNISVNSTHDSSVRKSSLVSLASPVKTVRRDSREMITGLESPVERQIHLQTINNDSFVNCFISLHYSNDVRYDECFHVSETVERSLDANFQEFNLQSMVHSKDSEFIVKIWISTMDNPDNWLLFHTFKVQLSSLLYLNKSLDKINIDIKNSVLISLQDGIYILPTEGFKVDDYKLVIQDSTPTYPLNKITVPSLSFDLIMKLNNLDTVIEDLQRSKKTISGQIDRSFNDSIVLINSYKTTKLEALIRKQKEANFIKRTKLDDLKALKVKKKNLLRSKKLEIEQHNHRIETIKEEYGAVLVNNENMSQELLLQRAQISKLVFEIFPKSDIQNWLKIPEFEILPLQLNLSNLSDLISSSDQRTIEELNAGFGYIAHIVFLFSRYFAIPLKYQIQPFGSSSYIIDKISQINQRKIFPLFYTNHFYRFQYAVILLNINIQDILKDSYHY